MNRNIIINNDNLDILNPTKNLYMIAETKLKHRENKNILTQTTDKNYGVSKNSALPDFGINMGSIPRDVLSSTSTQIESELYGINHVKGKYELRKRKFDFTPRTNKLGQIKFFDTKNYTFIPEPLVIEKNQRPTIF